MILWIIGMMFTWGFLMDNADNESWGMGIMKAMSIAFLWPVVLGASMKSRKTKFTGLKTVFSNHHNMKKPMVSLCRSPKRDAWSLRAQHIKPSGQLFSQQMFLSNHAMAAVCGMYMKIVTKQRTGAERNE